MLERFKPLQRLVRRLTLPRALLAGACLLTLFETGLALWVPLLTRDLIAGASDGSVPRDLVLVLVSVVLVEAVFSGLSLYLLARAGEKLTAFLRNALVGRLIRLPMSFHDERKSGELVSRTMSDTASVQSLLTVQAVAFVAGLVSMVGAVVILWLLDWRLTLVLFSSALVGLLLVLPVAARLQSIGKEIQDEQAAFSGRLAGVLGDMRLLKASCAESHEAGLAARAVEALRVLGLREARIYAVLGPTVTLGLSGALVVILGYGGARVASGALAVGTLVAFILYLFQVVMPMVQFSTFIAALNKAAGAAEHLSGLLDEAEEERSERGSVPALEGCLRFESVRHSYGDDRDVLRGFDLEIPVGKVTALVGPSGAGKTTVLSLLERFYAPDSGRIVVGGEPLAQMALEPWRRRVGYVSQEAPLLAGSVRDNLCYGLARPPSAAQIDRALRAARADRFVAELSEGLETEVGERGVKLSGGQRQRLALARAFLVDPEILMLDEATANLDAESESAIRDALAELMHGRTTVIVAHRLSTVVFADQIAVVEAGTVTGRGRHHELLASHDVYRDLVERQRLFEPEVAEAS